MPTVTVTTLEDLIARAIKLEKRRGISTVDAVNEVYDPAGFSQAEMRQLARIGFLRLVHEAKTLERNKQFKGPGTSPLSVRYDVLVNGGTGQLAMRDQTVSQLRSIATAFRIRAGVLVSRADAIDKLADFLVRRKVDRVVDLSERQQVDAAKLISEAEAAVKA